MAARDLLEVGSIILGLKISEDEALHLRKLRKYLKIILLFVHRTKDPYFIYLVSFVQMWLDIYYLPY